MAKKLPPLGVPYGPLTLDQSGLYVTCPVCQERIYHQGPKTDAGVASKETEALYAEHYLEQHSDA